MFADRADAGRQLAAELRPATGPHPLVLGLPRGGVPVAFEIAAALHAPLDVYVVRKLGAPGHEELAIGAIASGGVRVINESTVAYLGIDTQTIDAIVARETQELQRRETVYREDRPPHPIAGASIVLTDDGLATGASMQAAIAALRVRRPASITVAVPVAPEETARMLEDSVDRLLCLATPAPFRGVGAWYADFAQVTDGEVQRLLRCART